MVTYLFDGQNRFVRFELYYHASSMAYYCHMQLSLFYLEVDCMIRQAEDSNFPILCLFFSFFSCVHHGDLIMIYKFQKKGFEIAVENGCRKLIQ